MRRHGRTRGKWGFVSRLTFRLMPQLLVMTEIDLAWAAGLFDGEGCIWTRWPTRNNLICMEMRMTHENTMHRWNNLFPGRFVSASLSGLSKKPQWKWSVETNGAKDVLEAIYPYLFTKKEVAGYAIEMIATQNGNSRLMEDVVFKRNAIAAKIKELNA